MIQGGNQGWPGGDATPIKYWAYTVTPLLVCFESTL